MPTPQAVEAFIARWNKANGSERANHQLFVSELCSLLELEPPNPATDDDSKNAYVFERRVIFQGIEGGESNGFIDCYKRGSFVLEAKSTRKATGSDGWKTAMTRAHGQGSKYIRALPPIEGRPPFLITLDLSRGLTLELFSEFSQTGGTYIAFPDPGSHRLQLKDLKNEEIQERLRNIWLDPFALDTTRISAKVTREIAELLAALAKSLEADGHAAEVVAHFLMRSIFTMFAEDVGLLDKGNFTELLISLKETPESFAPTIEGLWQEMNIGGRSLVLRQKLLKFNGGLFRSASALPLNSEQIEQLIEAARADWKLVEPAIFGTLLERALDPQERHKLGAHYTPRAYVERLVMPTVINPLREEWENVKTAALLLDEEGNHSDAIAEIEGFHGRLCSISVLDPACGSGNFLYVTLEHLKRLEGEVLNLRAELGGDQILIEGHTTTIDPHQFLGIETNPRAAAIAESVIWIGYLQWHFRTKTNAPPPEPVLRDFKNIENRDAVLSWDRIELERDERGVPLTRWNGYTTKVHPVTGKEVPDEAAQIAVERYINPRAAEWPQADFIIGNPPFIGPGRMRAVLGDGYTSALRKSYPQVPESADFVMYWWHIAAELTRAKKTKKITPPRRFGFITTNSLRQTFNRRVIQHHMAEKRPLSLLYAIPDHPWVDAGDGAQVRIAMSVGVPGDLPGVLEIITAEMDGGGEGSEVEIKRCSGKLFADLRIGANVSGSLPLNSNQGVSQRGFELGGAGFIVTRDQAKRLGRGCDHNLMKYIKEYKNGRDLVQKSRDVLVIDLHGLSLEEVRTKIPGIYQWVLERVKPERDQNRVEKLRANWWLHRRSRVDLRNALKKQPRFIATVETTKHRIFVFLDKKILPDNKLINIALAGAFAFGILSSRAHIIWSLATGGWLGVGNDPVYVKTRCFETFPFPQTSKKQQAKIGKLAEQIDAHRKRQQAQHPKLTLTGIYNALEKLRRGEPLTDKEKITHQEGLISVLQQLHDELDAAVFEAYGWADLAPRLVGRPGATTPWPDKPDEQAEAEEELLQRLVKLNSERAAEEERGLIRWLRPEYQNPQGTTEAQGEAELVTPAAVQAEKAKPSWPKRLPDQVQALRSALNELSSPSTSKQLAKKFKRAQSKRVSEILEMLIALGQAREVSQDHYAPV